jgi:hypothetical protein
MGGEEGRSV